VVPVEREYWEVDPFGGELRDGVIWGRGALDMKNMVVMELLVLLLAKRHGLPLKRDIHYLQVADEEAGSVFGMEYIVREHPELVDGVGFVINEGSYGIALGHDRPVFEFATTEKTPLWLELSVEGRPGHGSVPHPDNCADRLIAALGRISEWRREPRVLPVVRDYIAGLTRAGLAPQLESDAEIVAFAEGNLGLKARVTNTVSLTGLKAGMKVNVIPAVATATLDCRLLPGTTNDAFLSEISSVIADEQVKIKVLQRYESAESRLDGALFSVVQQVASEHVEGAVVVPQICAAFTDSRAFRLRGVNAYGFIPCLLDAADYATIHGHNERISVDNLTLGTQILWEVIRRTACR
jgi:acetylornithine deacetylase/succinyl-diaminopimelate desuccinylase-like protein